MDSAEHSSDASEDDIQMDSDEELQEAFAAGLLKPGLNTIIHKKAKKVFINNVEGLEQKLRELERPLKKLPWIERLDHMVVKAAPLAPELAFKEKEIESQRRKTVNGAGDEGDDVHNDFKREMAFYRQAQATVLEVLPRLKKMGAPTKRPDDYFAQMAKTDDHMQKIREKLVSKQVAEERLEKVRKLREMKKFGKKVQLEVQQKRQKEKREMLDQVKKFRKGQTDKIDFLDDGPQQKGGKRKNPSLTIEKRKAKDKKFGFGGKKKGKKSNTSDSVNDVSSFRRPSKKPGGKKSMGKSPMRPGKARRVQMRSKK